MNFKLCTRLPGPESRAPTLLTIREGEKRAAAGEGEKPLCVIALNLPETAAFERDSINLNSENRNVASHLKHVLISVPSLMTSPKPRLLDDLMEMNEG